MLLKEGRKFKVTTGGNCFQGITVGYEVNGWL